MTARRKPKAKTPTFEDVLSDWSTHVPANMKDEPPKDKILDAFLRLFEDLTAAQITHLPPRTNWREILAPAVRWQWVALKIEGLPPALTALAPHVLTLAAARWLGVWQTDETPDKSRLMATLDRDLDRLHAAVQYFLQLRMV